MKNGLPIKIHMSSSGMCGFQVGRNTESASSQIAEESALRLSASQAGMERWGP